MSGQLYNGGIFYILVLLGAASVLVFLERLLHLRRAQIDYSDFLKGVCNVLENGNETEAMTLCEETPGPIAAVTLTAIRNRHSLPQTLREAVDNTGRAEMSRMERRLAFLAITCQISPLLGLLGTLICALRIVQAIHVQAPVVQSADLTTGLMSALAVAITGLLVAIPAHVMYRILMVRIERVVLEMEAAASEIVAYLMREVNAASPGE